jgi:hypothetical protein
VLRTIGHPPEYSVDPGAYCLTRRICSLVILWHVRLLVGPLSSLNVRIICLLQCLVNTAKLVEKWVLSPHFSTQFHLKYSVQPSMVD